MNAFSRCPKVVSLSGGIAGMSFSLPYNFGTILLSSHVGMSNKASQIVCIRPIVSFHEKSRKFHLMKPLLRQYQCCKYNHLKFICANNYFILSSLCISENSFWFQKYILNVFNLLKKSFIQSWKALWKSECCAAAPALWKQEANTDIQCPGTSHGAVWVSGVDRTLILFRIFSYSWFAYMTTRQACIHCHPFLTNHELNCLQIPCLFCSQSYFGTGRG